METMAIFYSMRKATVSYEDMNPEATLPVMAYTTY